MSTLRLTLARYALAMCADHIRANLSSMDNSARDDAIRTMFDAERMIDRCLLLLAREMVEDLASEDVDDNMAILEPIRMELMGLVEDYVESNREAMRDHSSAF